MSGSISRILTDIQYSLIQFCRSRQSIFFTLVFPGLFLIVLGYLLGYQAGPATIYYLDNDGSPASEAFIKALRSTGVGDIRDGSSLDLSTMLEDGAISSYIEIPDGFGNSVAAAKGGSSPVAVINLFYSRSEPTFQTGSTPVRQAVDRFNLEATGASEAVVLNSQDVSTAGFSNIDFLFPGILGMCIMFTAINETMSVLIRYRTSGLSQKLSATPLSTVEWNAAKIIHGTVIMLMSVAVSLAVAWVVFGIHPDLNTITILLIIVGSLMFVGLGMIVSSIVNDVKSVNAVAFSVTLPLMLISGSLFPVERLPVVLQFASIFSPLTCLNNGLRSAMITGDMGTASGNLFGGAFIALVLFAAGVGILMKNDGQDM